MTSSADVIICKGHAVPRGPNFLVKESEFYADFKNINFPYAPKRSNVRIQIFVCTVYKPCGSGSDRDIYHRKKLYCRCKIM
jgi:hypothetical protein